MDTYLAFLMLIRANLLSFLCLWGYSNIHAIIDVFDYDEVILFNQNKKANCYTWTFNIISLISLIILFVLFKNEMIYLTVTSVISFLYIIYLFIKILE